MVWAKSTTLQRHEVRLKTGELHSFREVQIPTKDRIDLLLVPCLQAIGSSQQLDLQDAVIMR